MKNTWIWFEIDVHFLIERIHVHSINWRGNNWATIHTSQLVGPHTKQGYNIARENIQIKPFYCNNIFTYPCFCLGNVGVHFWRWLWHHICHLLPFWLLSCLSQLFLLKFNFAADRSYVSRGRQTSIMHSKTKNKKTKNCHE